MKRKIPKEEVLRSLKKKGYGGDVSSVILEHNTSSKIKKKRKCNCKNFSREQDTTTRDLGARDR